MDSKYLDLIIKDLSGEITTEEKKVLWDWLPSNRESYNEIKVLWESIEEKEPEFPVERRWEELKLRIESETVSGKGKWKVYRKLAVAASLILALTVSVFLFLNKNKVESPVAVKGIFDSEKQYEIFYLPDSSLVWLNKNSRLVLGDNYNSRERVVSLEGEAFFQVKPDAQKPFFVHSGNTTTRVVGTSFNIEAYPGKDVSILVESGAVEFYNREHPATKLLLWASDKAICDSRGGMELISGKESINLISSLEEKQSDWKNDRKQIKDEQIQLAEMANPDGYIFNEFNLKENFINQPLIEGKLFNSAIFTSYKDIRLKAVYYSEDKKRMGFEFFDLSGNLLPGSTVEYKFKLKNWFKEASQVDVTVEKAKVIK